jgi:hypothetical protein
MGVSLGIPSKGFDGRSSLRRAGYVQQHGRLRIASTRRVNVPKRIDTLPNLLQGATWNPVKKRANALNSTSARTMGHSMNAEKCIAATDCASTGDETF